MKKALSVLLTVTIIISVMMSSATAKSYLRGDANLDGKVVPADARFILLVCLGMEMFDSEEAYYCCDINGDNLVTIADARLTLRIALSLDPQLYFTIPDETQTANIVTTTAITTTQAAVSGPPTSSEPTTNVSPNDYNPGESFTIPYFNAFAEDMPPIPQPAYDVSPDTFYIITYGYGHGVGMSAYGAMGMDHRGFDYLQILSHYYQGIAFAIDNIPAYITTEYGAQIPTYEFMCRCLQTELGGAINFPEALKAQAVAIYSVLKFYNYTLPNSVTVAYSKSYSSVNSAVKKAVDDTFGLYMTYQGKPIIAVYSAMTAGWTCDEKYVWETNYDYLTPVKSYDDILVKDFFPSAKYIDVKSYSSEKMYQFIKNYSSSIQLSEDPAEWLQVTGHDACLSSSIGYVYAMRVGDRDITSLAGQKFRNNIMNYRIRSHCFYIVYYDSNCTPHICV